MKYYALFVTLLLLIALVGCVGNKTETPSEQWEIDSLTSYKYSLKKNKHSEFVVVWTDGAGDWYIYPFGETVLMYPGVNYECIFKSKEEAIAIANKHWKLWKAQHRESEFK